MLTCSKRRGFCDVLLGEHHNFAPNQPYCQCHVYLESKTSRLCAYAADGRCASVDKSVRVYKCITRRGLVNATVIFLGISANQLGLFDEAELLRDDDDSQSAEETRTALPAHQRKKKLLSIPEHLPTTDIIYDLAEAVS